MSEASAQSPLVSVIVPAFNAVLTLGQSLKSALAGTYGNVELIVVDDGSTDATAEIAEEHADADQRVRVHRRRRGGVAAAFNSGLALARGDYLARLDSDDLWHPDKLRKQMDYAIVNREVAFIYTFARYLDDKGRVVRDAPQQHFPSRALCRGIYESLVGANSSALMRRSAVVEAGGYDESLSSWEDLLLQLKLSARHPIGFVPEYLVGYRVRPGSLSSDPRNMLNSWRAARRRIEQLFPQVPRFVRDWAHGKRCAELAEGFAWRGDYLKCACLLAEAAWHDPAWATRFLGYRLVRRLKQRRSPSARSPEGPPFAECRPDEQVRPDPFANGSEGRQLGRLEEKRRRRLAMMDEQLVRAVTDG